MKIVHFTTTNGMEWMARIVRDRADGLRGAMLVVAPRQTGLSMDMSVMVVSDAPFVSYQGGATCSFHVGNASFECPEENRLELEALVEALKEARRLPWRNHLPDSKPAKEPTA